MEPERIARLRTKYAELERLMEGAQSWDRDEALAAVGKAFGGAKTIPSLLDEIERLQAEHARLREAIAAHLDIISGKITGGIASPTLVLASALDLRRLIGKE